MAPLVHPFVGDMNLHGQAKGVIAVGIGSGVAIGFGIRNHAQLRPPGIEVRSRSMREPTATPMPIPTPELSVD